MQTLMLLSILFASAFACADEKMESEIHIHSLKKNIDVKKFGGKYKLHPYGETKSKLPTLQKRDADFKKAGLTQELSKYDQLDLDILYTDAQRLRAGFDLRVHSHKLKGDVTGPMPRKV